MRSRAGALSRLVGDTGRRPALPLATVAGSTSIVVSVTNWISDLGDRFPSSSAPSCSASTRTAGGAAAGG